MTKTPEDIPQINELLYTVKLKNGDELLVTLVDETPEGITIEWPIKLTVIPVYTNNGVSTSVYTTKWCHSTDEQMFNIMMDDILVYGPMSNKYYMLYVSTVNRYLDVDTVDKQTVSSSFLVEPSDQLH